MAEIEHDDEPLLASLRRDAPHVAGLDSPAYQRVMAIVAALGNEFGSAPRLPEVGGSDAEGDTLRQLGEYELLAELGRGGMGVVCRARHTRLDKIVAVKLLLHERSGDPVAAARFDREMRAVGRLDHPNIVRAMDAREIDGCMVLAMEYVEGLNLDELVQQLGPLPVAAACEIVRQAAIGLQYAHDNGLVHRDLTPRNLMVHVSGQVKILDLGIALLGREADGDGAADGADGHAGLTCLHKAMGTVDYMAPEQASDPHAVDIRADIYSLGCTFYRLLTGRAPFCEPQYETNSQKLDGHRRDMPPPVTQSRPDVPDGLAAIVARMMAKDPAARLATPAAVAAALAPFAAGADLLRLLPNAPAASSPADAANQDAAMGLASIHASGRRKKAFYGLGVALALGLGLMFVVMRSPPPGTLIATLKSPRPREDAGFSSVAADKRTIVVGSTAIGAEPRGPSTVYVFATTNGQPLRHEWASENFSVDHEGGFGYAVGLADDDVLVGAPYDKGSGTAHLFGLFDGTRRLVLEPTNALPNARFGSCVAIAGDYLLVAAEGEDGDELPECGAVYLFARKDGQLLHTFRPPTQDKHYFGKSLAFVGERWIAIGAQGDVGHGRGQVYLYENDGKTWPLRETIKPTDERAGSFGRSLAAEGNRLVVANWKRSFLYEISVDGKVDLLTSFPTGCQVAFVAGDVLTAPMRDDSPLERPCATLYDGRTFEKVLEIPIPDLHVTSLGAAGRKILLGDPTIAGHRGAVFVYQGRGGRRP